MLLHRVSNGDLPLPEPFLFLDADKVDPSAVGQLLHLRRPCSEGSGEGQSRLGGVGDSGGGRWKLAPTNKRVRDANLVVAGTEEMVEDTDERIAAGGKSPRSGVSKTAPTRGQRGRTHMRVTTSTIKLTSEDARMRVRML